MQIRRHVIFSTLFFPLVFSSHIVAQERRMESNGGGIVALDSKLELILERLALIETRLDRLEGKRRFSLFPVLGTESNRPTANLFLLPPPLPSIAPSVEAGMRLDAIERTLNRKAIDTADPSGRELFPRYDGIFIEEPVLRYPRR